MTLKKIVLFQFIGLFLVITGFSATTCIDSAAGTITGTSTTYTVSSTNPLLALNSDGIRTDDDNQVTLEFSGPVDLTIAPHLSNGAAVFSNQNMNNIFSGDAGSWSFTAGTQTAGYTPNPWYTFSGSTLTTDRITDGGGHGSGAPRANEDWGSFLITGVEKLTWTIPDGSNREAYKFSAEATIPIPEPSVSVLAGLGFSLLVARRKR